MSKKDRLNFSRKSNFYWNKEQDEYLIKNYYKTPINELEKNLDKNRRAIHSRISRLRKIGVNFKDKKRFLSKYWKERYVRDEELISNHKKAIAHLWTNQNFRNRHKESIQHLFKNPVFYEKHRTLFVRRRNSKKFKLKQSKVASNILKERHNNPDEHKKILLNLRKNPSNQQIVVVKALRNIFGRENVGCNDWNILDNKMEVDIPIYPLKIAVEWDGEYWHQKIKGTKERDKIKNKRLMEKGWSLIRVSSPSHHFQSKHHIEEKINILIGIISKIIKCQSKTR